MANDLNSPQEPSFQKRVISSADWSKLKAQYQRRVSKNSGTTSDSAPNTPSNLL